MIFKIKEAIFNWLDRVLNLPDAFELEDDENDILE